MSDRKKEWTIDEIELLQSIKRTHKEKKWKLISKNLAKKGFIRSEHECRHKWVNCLNPEINHGPWTHKQLQILYTQYEKNQSQWSIIQKSLPNRTQIRIKNHFYGILRNIMRFVLKHFKLALGKESEISNKINPNSFQLIYQGKQRYSFLKNRIRDAIFEMEFHFDKQKLLNIMEQNLEIFSQLNKKLLEQASNISQPCASNKNKSETLKYEDQSEKIVLHLQSQKDCSQFAQQSERKDESTLPLSVEDRNRFSSFPRQISQANPQMLIYNPLLDPFFLAQQLITLNNIFLRSQFHQ